MLEGGVASDDVYNFSWFNYGFITPNVAKAGGLQRQGAEGEAVMILPRALGNAVSEVLRLSRKGRKDASIIVA